MNGNLKIKVCGTRETENIKDITTLPIDYIGFIFYGKSARYVDSVINVAIPSTIKKVGVFVNASLDEIKERIDSHSLNVIQLHGDESPDFCLQLKQLGHTVIKAFGIDDDFEWSSIEKYVDTVDYFLFDTKSKAYGGTGLVFNWKKLEENPYNKPYFLSGGISIDNIEEAATFKDNRLYGLDINSKFEISPALKNIDLLKQALKIIK